MTAALASREEIRDALTLRDVYTPEPLWLPGGPAHHSALLTDADYLKVGGHGLPRRRHILGEYQFSRVVCSSRRMRWVGDPGHDDFQFTAQAHLGLAHTNAGHRFTFISQYNGLVEDHYTSALDEAIAQANSWLDQFPVSAGRDGAPWRWDEPFGRQRLDRRVFDVHFRVLARQGRDR